MPSPRIYRVRGRGFTLVEILVVVAIFTGLAGLGLFMAFNSYGSAASRSERDTVVSLLAKARGRAMNNYYGAAWGVCYLGPNYVIFRDAPPCVAGSPTVIFEQLTGKLVPQTPVTITITQPNHPDSIIFINNEGTINW